MESSILFPEIKSYESKKPSIATNGISRSKRRRLIKKEKWRLKKESLSSTSPPPSSTSPPYVVLLLALPSNDEGEVFEKVPSSVAGIQVMEEKKRKTPVRPYILRLRPRSSLAMIDCFRIKATACSLNAVFGD